VEKLNDLTSLSWVKKFIGSSAEVIRLRLENVLETEADQILISLPNLINDYLRQKELAVVMVDRSVPSLMAISDSHSNK
jgi:hypothetical protein